MKILTAIVGAFIGAILIGLILGALFAWPVQLLWNGCLVPAFKSELVNPIGFWQAWGLAILCSFLFKSTSSSKS